MELLVCVCIRTYCTHCIVTVLSVFSSNLPDTSSYLSKSLWTRIKTKCVSIMQWLIWSKQWIKCEQDYRLFSSLVFQCWVWLHSHPPEGHQVCTAAACLLIHAASCLQYKRPSHSAAGFYMFDTRVWCFVRRLFVITPFLLWFFSLGLFVLKFQLCLHVRLLSLLIRTSY